MALGLRHASQPAPTFSAWLLLLQISLQISHKHCPEPESGWRTDTGLPRIAELGQHRSAHGGIQIRIIKNDEWRIPTQFQ
jgi:hypothetical protein